MKEEHLIKRFLERQSLFMGYLMAMVRDLDGALEVFQNAAVVILEKAPGDEIRDFDAWAKEVVRRQALEYLREKARHASRLRSLDAGLQEGLWLAFRDDRTDEETMAKEREALRGCVGELPKKWREMVTLRYQGRRSFEDIGRAMAATGSAIQRTLSRIRKLLHECVRLYLAGAGKG